MINVDHLVKYVIRPTLEYLDMYSEAAENLLIGTAAHESRLEYLHQVHGPAIGLWQMEPDTYNDIYTNYLDYRSELKAIVRDLASSRYSGTTIDPDEMHGNLYYACGLARIHYRRVSEPLPDKNDITGLAKYYKRYYNSSSGSATEQDFIDAYNKVIA